MTLRLDIVGSGPYGPGGSIASLLAPGQPVPAQIWLSLTGNKCWLWFWQSMRKCNRQNETRKQCLVLCWPYCYTRHRRQLSSFFRACISQSSPSRKGWNGETRTSEVSKHNNSPPKVSSYDKLCGYVRLNGWEKGDEQHGPAPNLANTAWTHPVPQQKRRAATNDRLQEKVPETSRNNMTHMTQYESVGEPTLFVILVSKEGHQLSNVSNVCQQQIWNTWNTSKKKQKTYKTNSTICYSKQSDSACLVYHGGSCRVLGSRLVSGGCLLSSPTKSN